jgi:hypothetical protein
MRFAYVALAALLGLAYFSVLNYFVPNGYLPDLQVVINPRVTLNYELLSGLAIGFLTCYFCTFVSGRLNFGGVIGAVGCSLLLYYASDVQLNGSLGVTLAVVSGYIFEKIFLKPATAPSGSSS